MESLYLLIPLSALLVLAILGVFGWALFGGQFEELEGEGERILGEGANTQTEAAAQAQAEEQAAETSSAVAPALDVHQAAAPPAPEQSIASIKRI